MLFTHPQINLNQKNFKQVFSCFWQNPDSEALNKKLSFYFPKKKIVFTDMGRSAFRIIIEKLNLRNNQMLFPAYICDIFFPIFIKYNIKPIFLDADPKTFNIKIEEIERKITPQTKAILISNIYGLPNNLKKISVIAKKHNLKIIEDCAHSFAAKQSGKFVGNFGDASFFSLYKFLPVCRGGFLICPQGWQIDLAETRFNLRDFISFLNHFPFWAGLFKGLGGFLAPKITRKEKLWQIGGINKVSLNLFSVFFEQHNKNLKKRIKMALFLQKELKNLGFEIQEPKDNVFCFISALIPEKSKNKRDIFIKELRKQEVSCTRIWHNPIILNQEVQKRYKINPEEFPNALNISQRVINFPLQDYFEKKDAEEIISKTKAVINALDINT